jgi:hypothetical protein
VPSCSNSPTEIKAEKKKAATEKKKLYSRGKDSQRHKAVPKQYNKKKAACLMIFQDGICAFTVAWHRPQAFHKVLSHVGSFTDIRGGHKYPSLIRKTKDKPKEIRVFLQAGKNDLDNQHGHWPLANLQMEAAFKYAGYDHKFVMGEEGHNGKHGGAILPESLKWLWRDQ